MGYKLMGFFWNICEFWEVQSARDNARGAHEGEGRPLGGRVTLGPSHTHTRPQAQHTLAYMASGPTRLASSVTVQLTELHFQSTADV